MIIILKVHGKLDNCWNCNKRGFFVGCQEDIDKDFFVGRCAFCMTKRFLSTNRFSNGEAVVINESEIEDFIVSIL